MKRDVVTAEAPTRIDLAGGTLDLWPISQLVSGAITVNLAVEMRAHASVVPRDDGRIVVVSRDRRSRAVRRAPLGPSDTRGPLSWPIRLAAALGPDGGYTLDLRAEAPAGAGLGGSSALGVAIAWALDRSAGRKTPREVLLRQVQNLETAEIRVPTGNQDYLAAVHGGLRAYRPTITGTEVERIPVPVGLEERLVLAYTGVPRASGMSNWDMFRRFVNGQRRTVEGMESIARVATAMREALLTGDLDEAGRLLGEEGRVREHLAPTVSTPLLRKVAAAARRSGALGTKICGAGGGGCLVALSARGRQDAVRRAIAAAGGRILPVRRARRGVQVSGSRSGS
jgi:D-glycero-alpha-D-manno-heptose-7-phosphate kinase